MNKKYMSLNKNVYRVTIREVKYEEKWDCFVSKLLNVQIVIGLDNLKILLDVYPESTWTLVKDNGEGSYYD